MIQHILIGLELSTFQNKLKNSLATKIFQKISIQAYNSMHAYFFIGFLGFMLSNKWIADFTNLFFPNNFKNKFKIIFECFQ